VRIFKLLNVAGIIAKSMDGVAAVFNLSTAASTEFHYEQKARDKKTVHCAVLSSSKRNIF
jgi:hypothetical protein